MGPFAGHEVGVGLVLSRRFTQQTVEIVAWIRMRGELIAVRN
jgi:hypothetical protein